MSRYYIFCSPKEITDDIDYGFCVTVDCKSTLDYESILNIAKQEYGDQYRVHQVVSKNWAKLLKQYNKLFKYCDKHDIFLSGDGNCEVGTCCGYEITDGCIWTYGVVSFDDYSPFDFSICNLSDVDFANIVNALQGMVDYYKSCKKK